MVHIILCTCTYICSKLTVLTTCIHVHCTRQQLLNNSQVYRSFLDLTKSTMYSIMFYRRVCVIMCSTCTSDSAHIYCQFRFCLNIACWTIECTLWFAIQEWLRSSSLRIFLQMVVQASTRAKKISQKKFTAHYFPQHAMFKRRWNWQYTHFAQCRSRPPHWSTLYPHTQDVEHTLLLDDGWLVGHHPLQQLQ